MLLICHTFSKCKTLNGNKLGLLGSLYAVPVEHKTLFLYWHLNIVIKHFIAEVSQLFFTKEGLLESQLTLIIIMLMLWQHGVNTSLKSLLSSSAAVDWQIAPPSHFLFPSLVHCWAPFDKYLNLSVHMGRHGF